MRPALMRSPAERFRLTRQLSDTPPCVISDQSSGLVWYIYKRDNITLTTVRTFYNAKLNIQSLQHIASKHGFNEANGSKRANGRYGRSRRHRHLAKEACAKRDSKEGRVETRDTEAQNDAKQKTCINAGRRWQCNGTITCRTSGVTYTSQAGQTRWAAKERRICTTRGRRECDKTATKDNESKYF